MFSVISLFRMPLDNSLMLPQLHANISQCLCYLLEDEPKPHVPAEPKKVAPAAKPEPEPKPKPKAEPEPKPKPTPAPKAEPEAKPAKIELEPEAKPEPVKKPTTPPSKGISCFVWICVLSSKDFQNCFNCSYISLSSVLIRLYCVCLASRVEANL